MVSFLDNFLDHFLDRARAARMPARKATTNRSRSCATHDNGLTVEKTCPSGVQFMEMTKNTAVTARSHRSRFSPAIAHGRSAVTIRPRYTEATCGYVM